MPLGRLHSRTTKEILWIYILRLLMDKERYAYELRDTLKNNFGFEPARVTSYVVLYRLEKDGYVGSKWVDNKKYYHLTKRGEKLYKQGIAYLEEMLNKLR
ncbi:MAG: PadR family transcriptional regulator [Candidatus Hydrothermarchaeaceae archaeon]